MNGAFAARLPSILADSITIPICVHKTTKLSRLIHSDGLATETGGSGPPGIFSAKSEWPLPGRHQNGVDHKYVLGGSVFTPPTPVPPINIYDPQGIILDASASAKPIYDSANFCFSVPVPQVIYGINHCCPGKNRAASVTYCSRRAYCDCGRERFESDLARNPISEPFS